jgi:phosphatidylglycerophosphate synthase
VPVVQTGPTIGLVGQFALTGALAATVGLTAPGWVVGIGFGSVVYALLTRGLAHYGADVLGPADRVTLTRAALVGGVAALVAGSSSKPAPITVLMALTVPALALDAVDGWTARRTNTASALGARFDGEVDAFLILVLSVYVARSSGAWVLAIGAARYAFLVSGWLLPWMRAPLPPRYWRKVVVAIQGVVLATVSAHVVAGAAAGSALVVSLALLTESFGRDVWWLYAVRSPAGDPGLDLEPAGAI